LDDAVRDELALLCEADQALEDVRAQVQKVRLDILTHFAQLCFATPGVDPDEVLRFVESFAASAGDVEGGRAVATPAARPPKPNARAGAAERGAGYAARPL
jgi:hypothetical protein